MTQGTHIPDLLPAPAGGVPAASSPAPRVSVCVPVYNGAPFLGECLESLRRQSLAETEIIIVDDHSTDNSMEIASQFARQDPRFHIHRNSQRLGLVGNWAKCLEFARGDWIKFAFQDDVLFPTCLEKLLAACERQQARFGFCARNFIFEEGVSPHLRGWFANHARRLEQDYAASAIVSPAQAAALAAHDPSHNPVGEPTVTLIHKSIFAELGKFDDALVQMCDLEYWYRVLVRHGGVYVPEPLAAFRIHARAATAINLNQRAFRMGTLDLLVLRHRLAFGAHFGILRQKKSAPWRREYFMTAARAWRQVVEQKRAGNATFLNEWENVKKKCRGLQAAAWLGAVLEMPGRLRRAFKSPPPPGREMPGSKASL